MAIKVNYYDAFKCIQGECPFTCCKEWRIGIDDKTLSSWKGKKISYEVEGKRTDLELSSQVKKDGESYCIKLREDKHCPFLSKNKLCHIVTQIGEDFLSDTCTTFPRQINVFNKHKEYALDTGCPAVIDLIYNEESSIRFIKDKEEEGNDSLFKVRDLVLYIMNLDAYTMPEKFMVTFYALLDLLEEPSNLEEKLEGYYKKETLTPIVEAIWGMRFNLEDTFFECNELFLDVVENYRKQELYKTLIEPLALKAEALEASYDEAFIRRRVPKFVSGLGAFDTLFKNYVIAELFAGILMEDITLEDMVISFEWITVAYSLLRHALFLEWLIGGEERLKYEELRTYMTLISRVTGYELEDIKEYMLNSFESPVWEWGYLALIIGNERL